MTLKELPQANSGYFLDWKKAVITITRKSDGLRKISELQAYVPKKGLRGDRIGGRGIRARLGRKCHEGEIVRK
jgi:hypothetical protein